MALVLRDVIIGEDFDEEEDERDEVFIDKVVREFENEEPIEHDVYPESDNEEPEAAREREHVHIRRGDGRLYPKQTFFNGVAFKECVLDYALRTGRNVSQYRYDKSKIGFECVGGNEEGSACGWKVYAALLPKQSMWKITKFIDKHTCIPNGSVDMFKVPAIARMFVDKLREEPEYYMPMKIEEIVKERFGVTVSRPQCQAARNKALRWIETEYDHQFARLRDYAAEILVSNKQSTVEIGTIPNEAGQDLFSRFYVCFDVLRKTWKETCRPLIGVDGTFLKDDKVKGQLLVALGRDSDNAIYPIAWGVVQVENIDNWTWFVQLLKSDLDLGDGDGYIIVSDRQKVMVQ